MMNLLLPPIDEVINVLKNPEAKPDFQQSIAERFSRGINAEQLQELNRYRHEVLVSIAEIQNLNLDVLLPMAQAVEFVPFSISEIQEYIDENEDSEAFYELIYDDSAAFFSEGIIDRCIVNAANFIGIKALDADFVAYNREELIDECQALDGYEDNSDYWLSNSNSSVYLNSTCYVAHWIRITITEHLEDDGEYYDEQEELLEPYYRVLEQLQQLNIL